MKKAYQRWGMFLFGIGVSLRASSVNAGGLSDLPEEIIRSVISFVGISQTLELRVLSRQFQSDVDGSHEYQMLRLYHRLLRHSWMREGSVKQQFERLGGVDQMLDHAIHQRRAQGKDQSLLRQLRLENERHKRLRAHEFAWGPLHSIQGYLALAADEGLSEEGQRELLQVIRTQADARQRVTLLTQVLERVHWSEALALELREEIERVTDRSMRRRLAARFRYHPSLCSELKVHALSEFWSEQALLSRKLQELEIDLKNHTFSAEQLEWVNENAVSLIYRIPALPWVATRVHQVILALARQKNLSEEQQLQWFEWAKQFDLTEPARESLDLAWASHAHAPLILETLHRKYQARLATLPGQWGMSALIMNPSLSPVLQGRWVEALKEVAQQRMAASDPVIRQERAGVMDLWVQSALRNPRLRAEVLNEIFQMGLGFVRDELAWEEWKQNWKGFLKQDHLSSELITQLILLSRKIPESEKRRKALLQIFLHPQLSESALELLQEEGVSLPEEMIEWKKALFKR